LRLIVIGKSVAEQETVSAHTGEIGRNRLGNVLREDAVANISLSAAPGDVESATLRVKVGVAAA